MKIYTTSLCLLLLGVSSLVHGQAPASLSWGGSDSPSLRVLPSLAEFTGNALSGDVLGSVESGADLIAASVNALSSEPAQRSEMLSSVTRQTTQISNRISQLRSAAGNDDYLTARQIVSLYLVAYPNDLLYRYFVEGGGEVLIKPLSWGATYWSYHWSYEIQFDNSWIDNEWNRQEAVRHLRNHLEAMADENGSAINKHLTTWDGDIEAFLDRIAAAGVPLGVVFSPKQMTASQLEGLNEAIVETYRLVPYLGGFVLTFELASGQTLSFTVYGQRELTTGEKWLIIGTPAAGFAAGVLVKVGGKWVFRQITKRVDDLADLAPNRVGASELGNALSGLGSNPLTRNLNHLDEFGSGAGFSGVFDPATGKFLAYPSGTTRLANGNAPLNLVGQYGGHADVNRVLSELLGSTTNNRLGFSMVLDDAGNFAVRFNSRSVNSLNPNFPGRTVPENLRQQILDAIKAATGRGAHSAR